MKWMYYTEFGINLKLVCALDFSFFPFRIVVQLVTFLFA